MDCFESDTTKSSTLNRWERAMEPSKRSLKHDHSLTKKKTQNIKRWETHPQSVPHGEQQSLRGLKKKEIELQK